MTDCPSTQSPAPAAPKVDTHLVMNALNQLVALNSQPERKEVPLIFLLAEYLHEALTTLDTGTLCITHELQLMQAHLKLASGVSHHAVEMPEAMPPSPRLRVDRGAFTDPASVLFRSLRSAGPGRFQVHMDPETVRHGDAWMTCSMTMTAAAGRAAAVDQAAVRSRLSALSLAEDGKLRVDTVVAASQRTGLQVSAFFKVRVYEEAGA
ncbi:MAG: hypothetical protein V4757_05375 [Pseudomonadota bacterium]